MSTFAKSLGLRETVVKPTLPEDPALWKYESLITSTGWTDEGSDTPGVTAAASGSPTPLEDLPGATWNATEYFTDTNSERNTDHLAVFAWIRPTTIAGADRFILGKYDGVGPTGFRWYIRHTVSQQYAVIQTSGGTVVFTENVTSISLNQWQMIGLVWNPSTNYGTFYCDGVATRHATSLGGTGNITGSSVNMLIGVNSSGSNPFLGDIATPRGFSSTVLASMDEYARHIFEAERHIYGV